MIIITSDRCPRLSFLRLSTFREAYIKISRLSISFEFLSQPLTFMPEKR